MHGAFSVGWQVLLEPVKTIVETITSSGLSCLNVPGSASESMEAELFSDFLSSHGTWEILFVCEDQEDCLSEFLLREHLVELFTGLINSVSIIRVNHEDKTLSVLAVLSPEESNLVRTADIQYSERDAFVFDSLHIETNYGDSCDDFTELELVKNGGLTSGVKTDHEDANLAKETLPDFRKQSTHLVVISCLIEFFT